MTSFLIALQFLTTFPIQLKHMPSPQQNAQSVLFYPLVGLLIGTILAVLGLLLHALPLVLLSSLMLVLWIWLSGGLHLDGLADSADAWVGGFGDKERTLAIMKDPACGPIGVLSLIILCVIKWAALYVLLQHQVYAALILFPLLGRLAAVFLFLTTPYVRKQGLASSMAAFIPKTAAIMVMVLCVPVGLYFQWLGVVSMIAAALSLLYLRYKSIQRIDGMTGDVIGASIEITEAVSLLSFACALSYFSVL